MKKHIALTVALGAVLLPAGAAASTFDWTQILGNRGTQTSSTAATVGNLLEGILSTSRIEVADMAGAWTVTGSAVAFKSEDFLSRAGGLAAAASIETELNPYYQRYGLTGAVLTVNADGTCTLQLRRGTLRGVIEKAGDGSFLFKVSVLGTTLRPVPLYVQKSPMGLDMMFDATRLKEILRLVARVSGNSLAGTAVSLLDRYEGLCVGFALDRSGQDTQTQGTQSQGTQSQSDTGSGLDRLRVILGGGRNRK